MTTTSAAAVVEYGGDCDRDEIDENFRTLRGHLLLMLLCRCVATLLRG
jgi:hypothetical protein